MILDEILANKRVEVAARRAAVPLADVAARAAATAPPRDFLSALRQPGVSIISEIDGVLASPQAGLERYVTDLYDGTAAFTFGLNGGVLYSLNERFDLNGQLGLRYNSGLSAIDALAGTGLEDVNDKSARWTMPLTFGVRVKF